jgi:hypothetical protein
MILEVRIENGGDTIRFTQEPWMSSESVVDNLRLAAKSLRGIATSLDGMADAHDPDQPKEGK